MSAAPVPGPYKLGDKQSSQFGGVLVSIDAPTHGELALAVWTMEDDVASDKGSPVMESTARLLAASHDLLEAARNTIAYYAGTWPDRICLVDQLNPCGGLQHWGTGLGCPLCSARAALAKVDAQ